MSRLGVCQDNIPEVASMVNEAMEQLLYDPLAPEDGWWGGWLRTVFNLSQSSPYIVAPRGAARLILMDVCQKPVRIQNGFYEFMDFGHGLQPKTNCCSGNPNLCGQVLQGYDRETVPTLGTLSGPATIRIYCNASDVGKRVIVGGQDQNGMNVLSTDALTGAPVDGEIVVLNQPFADTLNQFTTITGIQKDATHGPVTFFQVNAALTQNTLSAMEPSETTAAYRRYLVNGLPSNCPCSSTGVIQVTAMAKLDFVPVQCDSDYLLIPCVPALLKECESIRLSKSDTKNAAALAQVKHKAALDLLFGQLTHQMGNERPAITMPIFGSNRLPRQPI